MCLQKNTSSSKWPNRFHISQSKQEVHLLFIDDEDFSSMNKPSDLQGAKVNLLCINTFLSPIRPFETPKMQVVRSENGLIIFTPVTNVNMYVK